MCLVDFTIVQERISDKLFGCLLSLILLLFSRVIFVVFVIVNVLYIKGILCSCYMPNKVMYTSVVKISVIFQILVNALTISVMDFGV
jgi:hypothetical protein